MFRRKKKKHLTREQRYQISALLQTGTRQKEIARIVGTNESTISREIKRNSSKRRYSAKNAQMFADERKERFSRLRKFTKEMENFVRDKIETEQ
ncbi:MAG: helix-turn-helix domain-containing protein, partial [Suipraeoptans sp.]